MDEERKITNKPPSGPILKNEFRKEVRDPYAGIPEDELNTRDQNVLRIELRFRIDGRKADVEHITGAIEKAKVIRMELLALPKSRYREECLRDLDTYISNNKQKLDSFEPPRSMLVTLLALEELFGFHKADAILAEANKTVDIPNEYDDELTIPEELPGDAVDEDDKPEEVI